MKTRKDAAMCKKRFSLALLSMFALAGLSGCQMEEPDASPVGMIAEALGENEDYDYTYPDDPNDYLCDPIRDYLFWWFCYTPGVYVTGQLKMENRQGELIPLKNTKIAVEYWGFEQVIDPGAMEPDWWTVATGSTDAEGNFSIGYTYPRARRTLEGVLSGCAVTQGPPNPDLQGPKCLFIRLVAYTESNDESIVVTPPSPYENSPFSSSLVSSDALHFGGVFNWTVNSIANTPLADRIWWLYGDVMRAEAFFDENGPPTGTTKVVNLAPSNIIQYSHYDTSDHEVYIQEMDVDSKNISLHNLAHFYMDHGYLYQSPDPSCLEHIFDSDTRSECAWLEGFADFFSIAVNNDPVFDLGGGVQESFETWAAVLDGDSIRGNITAALWDMYDSTPDLEGLEDNQTYNFNEIYGVVSFFKPDTFLEYWQSWKGSGYSSDVLKLFWLNGINYELTVIDDSDPDAYPIGSWYTSQSGSGYEGEGYWYANPGTGAGNFRWMLGEHVQETGWHEVFVKIPASDGESSATNAHYVVYSSNPANHVYLDQTVGGRWISLGTYWLGADHQFHSVGLFDDGNGIVKADAVGLMKVSSQ